MLPDFAAKHALLLQGPNGPFFRHFADELKANGVEVTRVIFNPGDALFFRGPEVVAFREQMDQWPEFYRKLLLERGIDAVYLFGDCRPHHKQARQIGEELGIDVWVFEEGYLRPHWITLERGGVNGHSSLPKDPAFYRAATKDLPPPPPPVPVGDNFGPWARFTTANAIATTLLRWRYYPHYRHHRDVNMWRNAFYWGRAFVRKHWYAARERPLLERFGRQWSGNYFLVPLQVYCDAQLQHSDYESMEQLIDDIVSTFAEHAPCAMRLVFKHHPHDRGYRDYTEYLREVGARYGCSERLVYVHDLDLPTLIEHACGVITMNSTVGMQSLERDTPVKVLGTAIYDMPELTCQRELREFLNDPGEVDSELCSAFRRYLIEKNQINGSFYRRAPAAPGASGLFSRTDTESANQRDSSPLRRGLRE
jgi:capsule polysaccharide modification protein KpsS